ncbi:hypothetical protein GF321_04755 [bacterium]|nr:hypothetical protein [bacterium]
MNAEKESNAEEALKPKSGGKLRLVLHIVMILAGWAIFGYFWFTVIRRGWYGRGIPLTLIAMALFSVLLVILNSLWIRHNKNIAKDNRRKSVPEIEDSAFIPDKTGLEIVFNDIEALKEAPVIEIEVTEGRKLIRPAAGDKENAREG